MRQEDKKKRKSKKKSKTPLAVFVILLLMVATGVGLYFTGNLPFTPAPEPVDNRPINPLTGLRAETLPNRVVQFSIDNVQSIPQSGLSKADIIYEFPAEGGLTRLQALFYAETPDVVGPIRSARPYFIDLAREYNAVFVHHGGSPAAFDYLDTGVVDDISTNTNYKIFWRSDTRYAPHDSMLNYGDLWEVIRERSIDVLKELRTFTFAPELTAKELEELKEQEDGEEPVVPTVTDITVENPYNLVEYKYIQETKLYEHYVDGELYIDAENDQAITASNILIQYVKSTVLDKYKRLAINMTAGGDALLFTGGNVVEGTWSRADLDSPTIFTDAEGNEFVLTRGKTWVHVIDQNSEVTYK
jgi:Protein of unknown function (DUF3048) N-terminal domain/Protein of unknown function (DUF3048) C-terminal domain